MKKLCNVFQEVRLLGFIGSIYRIIYEIKKISFLPYLFVQLKPIIPHADITLSEWRKKRVPCFFPAVEDVKQCLSSLMPQEEQKKIIDIADKALEGKIICFSHWEADFGNPVNWHLNPKRKAVWPKDVIWPKVMNYEQKCGDIKLTWELNRFPHVYALVRAYILTGDNKYVKGFCKQLREWEKENPYNCGPNWYNGQELAIRMTAWIFAVYHFADDPAFSEDDFGRFLKLLYLHTKYIADNISYAYYSVHNNHLIGEALALYLSGTLFPYYKESMLWKKKGREFLGDDKCIEQFYDDGGYCQLSFNYQRLALHYYIWAVRIAQANGEELSPKINDIFSRSYNFILTFINPIDGRLPNWGNNDGALLNPWTPCDFGDFRPLLNTLGFFINKKKCFPKGSWDEELFWFFGKTSLNSEMEYYQTKVSCNFPTTGLHCIRYGKENFISFRCGSVIDRFGQADQLHTDIILKGIPIAIDGGSYLYNDELNYHRYFMGTGSHNTVTVDAKDQMNLVRRFKWLNWTKAKLINVSTETVTGEHYGYKYLKGNVIHRRTLNVCKPDVLNIEDNLSVDYPSQHKYELHWLLDDFQYSITNISDRQYKIELQTKAGICTLSIESSHKAQLNAYRMKDGIIPDGWQSKYYGEKTPAISIRLSVVSHDGCNFHSTFKELLRN